MIHNNVSWFSLMYFDHSYAKKRGHVDLWLPAILTIIVLSMVAFYYYPRLFHSHYLREDPRIRFRCTSCDEVARYHLAEIMKMVPKPEIPSKGPIVLDCPKCKKHTLTQAVECPACSNIFIMHIEPSKGMFDDRCPKCGASYAKAWKEKYREYNE